MSTDRVQNPERRPTRWACYRRLYRTNIYSAFIVRSVTSNCPDAGPLSVAVSEWIDAHVRRLALYIISTDVRVVQSQVQCDISFSATLARCRLVPQARDVVYKCRRLLVMLYGTLEKNPGVCMQQLL